MRLLIGYDGSKFADAALSDLHRAGLPQDAQAIVLCAADVIASPISRGSAPAHLSESSEEARARVDDAMAEARSLAGRAADRLRQEFPRWNVSAEAVADSPGWAIIKRAEGFQGDPWRADLVIVGAAGHTAIGRVLFGSVAHQVLTHARCPVRIARAPHRNALPIRLLIGVDGSSDSAAAVRAVAGRTWPAGTECRVLTVVDSRIAASLLSSTESMVHHSADESARPLRDAGLSTTVVVKPGAPAHTIIQEAESFGADCIFVGARGLGRVERFLLGSVSAGVAMRAPCTVEVVHPG